VPALVTRTKADVRDMRPGEYSRSASSVWYRCTGCGSTDELGGHDYGIALDGTVCPPYECPSEECGVTVAIRLVGWVPFDVSDTESP
jgi:hypothetical protein